ncbi:MAG: protein kinase, partial [Ruminiclostridium sp.]|nr:protein kinase [Ruminiclostridium sp.]
IVEVYEYFYENNTVYLAMEYLCGLTLKEYIRDNRLLTAPQALYIAKGIGNALAVAHEASVLHRDITPDNIILCSDGKVKLIDFGAARQVIAEYSQNFSIILKPGFAPLEQYHKKGIQGPWTDIYALGATLYFGLTGDIPEDPMARFEDDDAFRENLFGIDPGLWSIIHKATNLKREDRYKDAEELLNDLNNVRFEPEPVDLSENTGEGVSALHVGAFYNYKQHITFSSNMNKVRVFFSDSDKQKVLYSTLDDKLKELYELIFNCIANNDEAIELAHDTYDENTARAVYQRVLFDNPQFFYTAHCSIDPGSDESDGSVHTIYLKPVYIQTDKMAMKAEISEIVRISRKDNNIDTLCAIHNYMIANTKAVERNSDLLGSSAYGVTINKLADDIGFAKAFCYYVREAGLPCYAVEGEFMGKPRAWCRFKLEDDVWYNADVYGDKFSGSAVTKLKITNDGNYFQTYFLTNDK